MPVSGTVARGCCLPSRPQKWLRLRVRKWLIHPVCGRLYRDPVREIDRSMIVAGAGRSGTTWLADLVAAQTRGRVMYEPCHSRYVRPYSGFNYFQYMRPGEDNTDLRAFLERLFSGDIRHPWIDREVSTLRPDCRVVKEIRANLFLRWISLRFPQVPLIFLIRHPCAVVLSRLKLNWATDGDIEPFLQQDKLVSDFLLPYQDLIRGARTPEEKHAIVWSISNLVPLRQFAGDSLSLVFYENLLRQPEIEIPRIFSILGRPNRSSAIKDARQPSAATRGSSAVMHGLGSVSQWKSEFSVNQADRVLRVVAAFGLDGLYGDDGLPVAPRAASIQASSDATDSPSK